MLDPRSWLEKAQALKLGQRKRTEHDCGSGRTLVINHKQDGWSAYCWRCSDNGWVYRPQEGLGERIARLRAEDQAEALVQRDLRPPMPADFNPSNWPLEPRVWLYKAGLSNEAIQGSGFYYHEPTKRVVLPVFDNGALVYWQARGFDASRPKYLNPEVDRTKLVAKYGQGDVLVLTEDILSAKRVSLHTEAWSILGTAIPDPVLGQIIRTGKPVLVWLDPDDAGRKGTSKAVAKLRAYGVEAKAIRTDRDPKLYSAKEIATVIRPDTAAIA